MKQFILAKVDKLCQQVINYQIISCLIYKK